MIASEEFIEELILSNTEKIRAIAQKMKLSGGNEDDLVQEGLIGFVDGVKKYDTSRGDVNSSAFVPFCLMCAKRQMLDAIRHAGRKKYNALNQSLPLDNAMGLKENRTAHNPEQEYIEKETEKERLNLVNLNKTEKKVIEMLILGLTAEEIADALGKSKKAVEDIFYRLRKKVKGE